MTCQICVAGETRCSVAENPVREDDFSTKTKRLLAARVGHVCSCPGCRAPTAGPQLDPEKAVTAGDAAHITAASPKGPRYDASLTPDQRRHYKNGIWLCASHARIVDQDTSRYTVEVLRRWKVAAETEAHAKIGRPQAPPDATPTVSSDAQPNNRKAVLDFLAGYRKLVAQSRGCVLGQLIRVNGVTDLASWRRAQVNGTLREFERLAAMRNALWASPEAVRLLGSVRTIRSCLKYLNLDPTQEDIQLRGLWNRYSDVVLQIGSGGPQTDAQVLAWHQAVCEFANASLTAHTTREGQIEEGTKKWLAEVSSPSVGQPVDPQKDG